MDSGPVKIVFEFKVDRDLTKELLCGAIHAILFHRAFGCVKPTTRDALDVTLPAIDDEGLTRTVERKVDQFKRLLDDSPRIGSAGVKRGQMAVVFSELRAKNSWFSSGEEEVPWEEWTIIVEAHSKQGAPRAATSQALAQALYRVIVHTSSAHGREIVPQIRAATTDLSPFPYSIKGKLLGRFLLIVSRATVIGRHSLMPESIVTTLGIGKDKFPFLHSSFNRLSPHLKDGFRVVLVGAVFDFARRVCEVAWAWIYGAFTVTATFEAGDEAYDWINEWLKQQPRYSDSRNFDVFAKPRDVDGTKPIEPAVEEGKPSGTLAMYFPAQGTSHWMTYKSRLLRVSRKRAPIEPFPPFGGSPAARDSITLTLFALTQNSLQDLIENCGKEYRAKELTHIVIWIADQYGNWKRLTSRPHRDLSSVVLDPNIKSMLINDAKEFLGSERWYADRGIPYRRGYLLYGTPGSGKSSSIHALASELRLDIYIVPLSMKTIDDGVLSDLITSTPQRCIILYEDIDAAFGSRVTTTSTDARGEPTEKSGITLSGLLNTIDGVQAQEGRLLFATTNHPERLDPALSRPGRMDVKVEYTHATQWQAEQLFRLFYPVDPTAETKEKDSSEFEDAVRMFADAIPPLKVSVAQLQGFLMRFKGKPVEAAKEVGVWLEEELGGSA